MLFRSVEEMENYILSSCMSNAIKDTIEQINKIIEQCVRKFYGEYGPKLYERTYQLFRSYIKTNVVRTGMGYEARVYFDASSLDHSIKHLTNGYTFPNSGWSEDEILETALVGSSPHGGYSPAGGTGIWISAEPLLNSTVLNYLKQALIANGLPIV